MNPKILYTVKLVGTDGKGRRRERTFPPCSRYEVTHLGDKSEGAAALDLTEGREGIDLEMVRPGGRPGEQTEMDRINLPRDGHSVYITNAFGKTVDSHHWPPRSKEQAGAVRKGA